MNTRLLARRNNFDWCIDFSLQTEEENGRRSIATNLILEPREPGQLIKPTFSLPEEAAQALFEELWAAGFRPANEKLQTHTVHAIEKHLEDMRALAFGKLGVLKP